MVFDPDESGDSMLQGFTMMTPGDLPNCIPARSLSDNMESQRVVTGKMRSQEMSSGGSEEALVKAYTAVQFGNKANSSDAYDVGLKPEVGSFVDNGQGSYDHTRPPELYENANEPLEDPNNDDD